MTERDPNDTWDHSKQDWVDSLLIYKVCTLCACYVANADASGMSDTCERIVDDFVNSTLNDYPEGYFMTSAQPEVSPGFGACESCAAVTDLTHSIIFDPKNPTRNASLLN